MRILIAEDSFHQREALRALLEECDYEVEAVADGDEAWKSLQREDSPDLVLLDSVMPGMTGPELCARARQELPGRPRHIILLTVRGETEDIRIGLDAGADDYIIKPYQEVELRARLHAGCRAVSLQLELARRVRQLEAALDRVEKLEGILPICSYCKKIRDDQSDWKPVEEYLSRRSDVRFSHGICPGCYTTHVEPMIEGMKGTASES